MLISLVTLFCLTPDHSEALPITPMDFCPLHFNRPEYEIAGVTVREAVNKLLEAVAVPR